jgi:hypothetical protein
MTVHPPKSFKKNRQKRLENRKPAAGQFSAYFSLLSAFSLSLLFLKLIGFSPV